MDFFAPGAKEFRSPTKFVPKARYKEAQHEEIFTSGSILLTIVEGVQMQGPAEKAGYFHFRINSVSLSK
jgi:hypothetical protein